MATNMNVIITTTESSRKHLMEQIEWVLDLMEKEQHHCYTHSQRNKYQAVIRRELEIIHEELQHARFEGQSEIPF